MSRNAFLQEKLRVAPNTSQKLEFPGIPPSCARHTTEATDSGVCVRDEVGPMAEAVQHVKGRRLSAEQRQELAWLTDPESSPDPELYRHYARRLKERGWAGQRSAVEIAYCRGRRG